MATILTFYRPTFYPFFLPLLFQIFPEAESVVVVEHEVFALVFAAVELFPEVVALGAGPEVVFVVDLEVSEPRFVFLAPFSIVHASGRPGLRAYSFCLCRLNSSFFCGGGG